MLDIFKWEICEVHPTATSPGRGAKIIIVAPYEGQKNLIMDLPPGVSDVEFVRDLVEVRTILGVQGHEAAIVIFDTTRSKRLGFLFQYANANVALTRAKHGLIVIGSEECWKGSYAIASLARILPR